MYTLAEVVPDFVKILGYGLSGFAFLLMFFAYMLLRQVISKSTQSQMIFKSIWGFMGLSFLLTIAIGVFSYMTGDYKQKELADNKETIETQKSGLEILNTDQKLDSLVKNVVADNTSANPSVAAETMKQHEKIVSELEAKVEKANATPEEKRQLVDLKTESTKTLDSLNRPDLSPEAKNRLNNKYLFQTGEISKISTHVVKRATIMNAAGTKPQDQ